MSLDKFLNADYEQYCDETVTVRLFPSALVVSEAERAEITLSIASFKGKSLDDLLGPLRQKIVATAYAVAWTLSKTGTKAGKAALEDLQTDLQRMPWLLRGISPDSTFTLRKNDDTLAVYNLRIVGEMLLSASIPKAVATQEVVQEFEL